MKTSVVKTVINGIEFNRVNNDVNGNPRYVVHFLQILSDKEKEGKDLYQKARKKANKLGGKVYRAKWFGGGLVFQSYDIKGLAESFQK